MDTICDTCRALYQLNEAYNRRLGAVSLLSVRPALDAGQIGILNCFVNSLHHRVCTCCFLQLRQYDLVNNVVQALLQTFIEQTKLLPARQWNVRRMSGNPEAPAAAEAVSPAAATAGEAVSWSLEQLLLLSQLTAKVLQPQFAPYLAYKQAADRGEDEEARGDEEEDSVLAASVLYRLYCDVSDPDVSEYTLRNVCYLCEHGAPAAITAVFRTAGPSPHSDCPGPSSESTGPGLHSAGLPPALAHALVVVAVNLKMWMAGAAGSELMAPLRPAVIGYMCQLNEAELKSSAVRSLSDFMWSSLRSTAAGVEPSAAAMTSSAAALLQLLDEDGLRLALKFFASSTLTVRLAGIGHINSHVGLYSELLGPGRPQDPAEGPGTAPGRDPGCLLADWLVQNKLVEQMYGPNLHVEIVKQSPVVLNFLAMEGRLTNEHIELIFQATQLKHCGKQVYDILAPLIKNLEPQSILYLYRLLQKMEPKDHTEQSLYLASVLIKFVWNCSAIAAATSSTEPLPSLPLGTSPAGEGRGMSCLMAAGPADDDDGGVDDGDEDSCSAQPSDDEDGSQRQRSIHLLDTQLADMVRFSGKPDGGETSRGVTKLVGDNCDVSESDLCLRERSPSLKDRAVCDGGGCVSSPVDDEFLLARTSPALVISPVYGSRKRSILQSQDSVMFPRARLLAEEVSVDDCSAPVDNSGARQSISAGGGVPSSSLLRQTADGEHRGEGSPAKRVCRSSPVNFCDESTTMLSPDVLSSSRRRAFLSDSCRHRDLQLQLVTSPASSQPSSPSSPPPGQGSGAEDGHCRSDDPRDQDQLEDSAEDHKLTRDQLRTIRLHHPGGACVSDEADTSSSCSRMSAHSDRQLSDFLAMDAAAAAVSPPGCSRAAVTGYDEELVQLALQAASRRLPRHLASMATMYQRQFGSQPPTLSRPAPQGRPRGDRAVHPPSSRQLGGSGVVHQLQLRVFARFAAENVCRPGQTLLWDLLQDERIGELGDGVAVECERILTHLLCHSASASVRRRFVSGCLDQLACQRSVMVVLRLLPKLLASFDQLGSGGTHQVTIWAEEEHSMMERFFSNLQQETLSRRCPPDKPANTNTSTPAAADSSRSSGQFPASAGSDVIASTSPGSDVVASTSGGSQVIASISDGNDAIASTFSESDVIAATSGGSDVIASISGGNDVIAATSGCEAGSEDVGVFSLTEVQTRLDFLSAVFSSLGSPEQFRLSVDQVDMLWACLADSSPSAADALFTWMLSQVGCCDQHALGTNSLRHLLSVKLPSLSAERTSMKALRLYQQLRMSYSMVSPEAAIDSRLSPAGFDTNYLWSIALRATDTDVALSSIEYLNSCYVSASAERERQFIERCMAELGSACSELSGSPAGERDAASDGEERCLLRIQRGLQLLSRHLQTYKKRFAYHLRRWILCGRGIVSHAQTVGSSSLLMSTHRRHYLSPPSSPTTALGGAGGRGPSGDAAEGSPGPEASVRSWCRRPGSVAPAGDELVPGSDCGGLDALLHVVVQPVGSVGSAGGDERRLVRLSARSYLAELRAEAHYHWLQLLGPIRGCPVAGEGEEWSTVFGVRLITQDLELTADRDESTLAELGFKDMQVVYTSMGAHRRFPHAGGVRSKDSGDSSGDDSAAPSRAGVPMLLLLQEPYFNQLLLLMQQLAALRKLNGETHYKGQILARSVWNILLALPTAPRLYQLFSELPPALSPPSSPQSVSASSLHQLLDPESPQRLLYALYLVSHLCNSSDEDKGEASGIGHDRLEWSRRFLAAGGLSHLNSILMSGALQSEDSSCSVDEWRQDCLICILHVLLQLATIGTDPAGALGPVSSGEGRGPSSPQSPTRKRRRSQRRSSSDPLHKSRLNQAALATLDVSAVVERLCSILYTVARQQGSILQLKTGLSSRAQLVQHVFSLMLALCVSCPGPASSALFASSLYRNWLRALLLEESEPSVRWETADGLIRLCLYCTTPETDSTVDRRLFLFPVLRDLVVLLPVAENLGNTVHLSTDSAQDAVRPANKEPCVDTCEKSLTVSSPSSLPSSSPHLSPPSRRNVNLPSTASGANPPPSALLTAQLAESGGSAPSVTRLEPAPPIVATSAVDEHHKMASLAKVSSYGRSCCQYFSLVGRLLEQTTTTAAAGGDDGGHVQQIEWLRRLLEQVAAALQRRRAACELDHHHHHHHHHHRHQREQEADPGLVGLLRLLTVTVRNLARDGDQSPLRDTARGSPRDTTQSAKLLEQVFEYVFALPSPRCRSLPLCKSAEARAAGLDLLVELVSGSPDSFDQLLERLQQLVARPAHHLASGGYPWDYWPHDDGRSDCGYVGLTNLGATCYMASCMQHLFMMPLARASILEASVDDKCQHETTLHELQRMFAYLMEGERKAYNPRSFCNVYTMDHRPLNTGDQKDMAEFFIDLVSKLEDMSPSLCAIVKQLFCGQITNNVVSLDCVHVSRTCEEFYTVRCQVADMRSLYHSLDELTVKDTLEGDNMYTCSQCQKKVRAEKRACFKKLPHILCFNTMRYTFNMNTMLREKVNTLFSFPLLLDMSPYLEETLMPDSRRQVDDEQPVDESPPDSCLYELIGVTVHTGTAEGGHYYSFIRDHSALSPPVTGTNEPSAFTTGSGEGDGGKCGGGGGGGVWLLFNDAEVKPFDSSQLPGECFGGEMTSKTYDSISDKFLDFSFEKTNSAYMLFYERFTGLPKQKDTSSESAADSVSCQFLSSEGAGDWRKVRLRSELEQWVWKDNMEFLMDKNLFDHSFFTFMWQVCGYIPQTLSPSDELTLTTTRLSTTFFLEIFIHAKEKPTMVQWVKLLTKQFNTSQMACEWFLDHMAGDHWWPVNILIKCGNQMVRQMFHRLCIHVIQRIRHSHSPLYLSCDLTSGRHVTSAGGLLSAADSDSGLVAAGRQLRGTATARTGQASCVTRFVNTLFSLLDNVAKQHVRNLGEYFSFLLEFARMGSAEIKYLLSVNAVSYLVNFYLSQLPDTNDDISDGDDDEELLDVGPSLECRSRAGSAGSGPGGTRGCGAVGANKLRAVCLERLVTLVGLLVEHGGRGSPDRDGGDFVPLSTADLMALSGGKSFAFVCNLVRDGVGVRPICVLLLAMCRSCSSSRHQLQPDQLAEDMLTALFIAVVKYVESSQSFFRLISLLIESDDLSSPSCSPSSSSSSSSSPPPPSLSSGDLPSFSRLSLPHVWSTVEQLPHATLEWLAQLVATGASRQLRRHVLGQLDSWCTRYLLAHSQFRVRAAASHLIVSLVPSAQFRLLFAQRSCHPSDVTLSTESAAVLHQVYVYLLSLLRVARSYTDVQQHGTMKLVQYFQLMQCCVVSRTEKLQFGPYTGDLWNLLYPKLSEPPVAVHHNKQALFSFWQCVCTDCPQNVRLILANSSIVKNIAFNYILADHDDDHVVLYNRASLPVYYSLLRLCCIQSRQFTRRLASHQNIQWAFKNIALYPGQYSTTVDELFKLMKLFVTVHPDADDSEVRDIITFKRQTLQMFVQVIDPRCAWSSLNTALQLLAGQQSERLLAIYSGLLKLLAETLDILHSLHHEPVPSAAAAGLPAGQLLPELKQLVAQLAETLACCKTFRNNKEVRQAISSFKDGQEMVRKLATLLNGFSPADLRCSCIDALKDLVVIQPRVSLSILVPFMLHAHTSYHQLPAAGCSRLLQLPLCRPSGSAPLGGVRVPRPLLQMSVPKRLKLATPGQSSCFPEPDADLVDIYLPYHLLADLMCRVAVNNHLLTEPLVRLSSLLSVEAVPLHLPHFAKFWIDVHLTKSMKSHVTMMLQCCYVEEYMKLVLTSARPSLCNSVIYKFFTLFLHKVPAVWRELTDISRATSESGLEHRHVADCVEMDEEDDDDPGRNPAYSLLATIPSVIVQVKRDLQVLSSAWREQASVMSRVLGDVRALYLLVSCVCARSVDGCNWWRQQLLHVLKLTDGSLVRQLSSTSPGSCSSSSCLRENRTEADLRGSTDCDGTTRQTVESGGLAGSSRLESHVSSHQRQQHEAVSLSAVDEDRGMTPEVKYSDCTDQHDSNTKSFPSMTSSNSTGGQSSFPSIVDTVTASVKQPSSSPIIDTVSAPITRDSTSPIIDAVTASVTQSSTSSIGDTVVPSSSDSVHIVSDSAFSFPSETEAKFVQASGSSSLAATSVQTGDSANLATEESRCIQLSKQVKELISLLQGDNSTDETITAASP